MRSCLQQNMQNCCGKFQIATKKSMLIRLGSPKKIYKNKEKLTKNQKKKNKIKQYDNLIILNAIWSESECSSEFT